MLCVGDGPHKSVCTSAPKESASGASCSLRITLRIVFAYLHESHDSGVQSSISCTPSTAPLLTSARRASGAIWHMRQCNVWRSTRSSAVAATYVCSTLYNPFVLAGMTPMTLSFLFLIVQVSSLKMTEFPALQIRQMDTIVNPISGA